MKKLITAAALIGLFAAQANANVTVDTDGNGSSAVDSANATYSYDLDLQQATYAPQFTTTIVTDPMAANNGNVIAYTAFKIPTGVVRYVVAPTIEGNSHSSLAATVGAQATDATTGKTTIHGAAGDIAYINVVKTGNLEAGVQHVSYVLTAWAN
ncbi:hypothetical protein KCR17_003157 [Salmonella enterica]|uniref:Uncharacterized protein n=1 Tax=Salmonella enterica TaxID=28901 RepID=A0A5T2WI40_SALER|nr:hypothetical protein [Salmonella enterica]ECA5805297.1 hypothetical protein [Salmonella enterica subsp. enterica serovar Newport]ECE9635880.1 hypothetical protein [Salmonella enterica subsp. enterica serovar Muenchen]ECY5335808.1 hypothetical protein [Salmonella enterica subsp. enterica serovar Stanley]EAM8418659.1 hypothetical protein [Salmonella enterica]EAU2556649.1 hypothetical protein [Salmonella enterica]